MITTFLYTLTPMLYLFLCLAIGFTLRKTQILPENSSKVMAKLENWVFCPALSFMTMATYCRVETFTPHLTNILLSCIIAAIALAIALSLSRFFVREKCYDRGVYAYGLMFGNFGYVGDPLVIALFGGEIYAYYKLFTLPLTILCYVWGISVLVPPEYADNGVKGLLKKVFTPPVVALLIGLAVGFTGTLDYFPEFLLNTLDGLKACYGPVAMLLAGFTIAGYTMSRMLKKPKVYVATAFRLVILPAVIITVLFGIVNLFNLIPGMNIGNLPIFLTFFAFAAPLGMNTIVFPEAYGGDPETGASMAMISHTLCVITIPILYALMTVVFGTLTI